MRRIAFFTGTRAEYGLLYWALRALDEHPDVDLQLIVAGSHLSAQHGHTIDAIRDDGFTIGATVDMLLSSDTPRGVTTSAGVAMIGLGEALERLAPDLLVLVGDRYEALAAGFAAAVARVPIAHLHGGEVTEGAIDEQFRHALTKLAHVHLVAAPEFASRVTQMGEPSERVHVVGAPGLDHVKRLDLLDRGALEQELDLPLGTPTFLVTYHPVTAGEDDSLPGFDALTAALDRFPDATVICTAPNADAGGGALREALETYARIRREGSVGVYASLGQLRYLSAVAHADVVVGNSSSGLIEVPALGTPTVNIGSRQGGRLRGATVIDVPATADAIADGIARALDPEFQRVAAAEGSPYGDGQSAERIVEVLLGANLDALRTKRFTDLPNGVT